MRDLGSTGASVSCRGRRGSRLVSALAVACAAAAAVALPGAGGSVAAASGVPPLPDGLGPRDAGSVVVIDPQQREVVPVVERVEMGTLGGVELALEVSLRV